MTSLSRAALIRRFGTPVPRPFGILAPRRPTRVAGVPYSFCANVRDSGTMPVMNDEVPGVAGIERETTSMAHDGTRFTSSHGSSDGHSVTTPTRNTNRWLPALKAAFPLTIPICLGFLFLGASYGILSGTIVYMLLVQLVF